MTSKEIVFHMLFKKQVCVHISVNYTFSAVKRNTGAIYRSIKEPAPNTKLWNEKCISLKLISQ